MSNTIVASLGDVVLYSEDVDTLDEWLNDQVSARVEMEQGRGTKSHKKKPSPSVLLAFFSNGCDRTKKKLNLDKKKTDHRLLL